MRHLRVSLGLVPGIEHLFVHRRVTAVVFIRLDRHLVFDTEGEKSLRLFENMSHHLLGNAMILEVKKSEVLASLRKRSIWERALGVLSNKHIGEYNSSSAKAYLSSKQSCL